MEIVDRFERDTGLEPFAAFAMHFCGTLCLSGFFEEQRRPGVVMKARAKFGGFEGSGVRGDPSKASAEYGRVGIQMKVDAALRQISELMAR